MSKEKRKLSPEERAAKRAERKAKIKAMESENNTRWQAIKYFICMCSAGIIQLVSSSILEPVLKAAAPEWSATFMYFITPALNATFTASTIGLALSILWNFTLNRKFTFKAANNVPLAMFLAFLFYVPFYPFQIWFVATVQGALGNTTGGFILATGLVMILNGILEFCWQKFVIYRKSTNTAVKKDAAEETAEVAESCSCEADSCTCEADSCTCEADSCTCEADSCTCEAEQVEADEAETTDDEKIIKD